MINKSISQIEALILDMDGVLWLDNEAIGNLPVIFSTIDNLNLNVAFVTNNSTSTLEQINTKFQSFGVEIEQKNIITSAFATALFLKEQYPPGSNIFVVGEHGLFQAVKQQGFVICKEDASAVVIGLDRDINYEKIQEAANLVRNGADFIATNPDITFPTPYGLAPGAGSIVAAVEAASGVRPCIIGKPQPTMYSLAIKTLESDTNSTLVVGDRLETDIAAAQAIGCPCSLVLSGVTSQTSANAYRPKPDLIKNDLSEIVQIIAKKVLE